MMSLSESAVTPLPEDYFAALAGDVAVQKELEALMQAAMREIRNTPLVEIGEHRAFQPDPDEVSEPVDHRGVYPLSGDPSEYRSPRQND
ncbi:MAG: hypothetical protein ABIG34_03650 [Candidatus Peregrinibacteria bacterium]